MPNVPAHPEVAEKIRDRYREKLATCSSAKLIIYASQGINESIPMQMLRIMFNPNYEYRRDVAVKILKSRDLGNLVA